jgi:hypothetical protein
MQGEQGDAVEEAQDWASAWVLALVKAWAVV